MNTVLGALADAENAFAAEADTEALPRRALDHLRAIGGLTACLPVTAGGADGGCARQGEPVAAFFRAIGRGSVSLGRLVEGHVNALRLVWHYGDERTRETAARDAHAGHLFGVWVTDGERALALRDGRLDGGKAFCSGVGAVARALVTAATPDGGDPQMLLVPVDGVAPDRARAMSGVRGAQTADVTLDGLPAGDPIGRSGDYLRQPEFSAGAWRGSAVACGALEALVDTVVAALAARGRLDHPHQASRVGRLLIARDTARLWVDRASIAADGDDPGAVAATVNLARIAVESACLDAIPLAQRALGLQGLLAGARAERIGRDLATYLRQPAPDETLTEAALWFARHGGGAAR